MSRGDHARVMEVFRQVIDLERSDRSRALDEACGDDAALRADVEALLELDGATGDVFAETKLGLGRELAMSALDDADEALPHIGPYRPVRVIGRGGMGVVYEAEQDAPRRTVAVKLLQVGMASDQMRRRFELEAELLGRLQHPGIAQVYEAGTVGDGHRMQPFFAMELVDGAPLTDFADRQALDTRGRLALLADVAEAAHHAHQRGVIHRDLKPDNILVDGQGRARILDFGIARAVDRDDTPVTAQTQAGQILGTLAYMSPEQVTPDRPDLDSRVDVYALGVIGYELLSNRLPIDPTTQNVPHTIRMIAEHEPPRLGAVDRRLRGDVETIIARAMAKDRDRRYGSASELAADIRRWLAHEPIVARRPSTIYQIRTFARRNRAITTGLAMAFVALLGGVIASTLALREAGAERDNALEQQRIAEAVNQFLNEDLLAAVAPERQGIDVSMREVLAAAAERIEGRFPDQPLVEAGVRSTLGQTYLTLGELEEAEGHLRRALELQHTHRGPDHPETLQSTLDVGWILKRLGRYAEGEPYYVRALEGFTAIHGREHEDTLLAMNNLGALYDEWGRYADAEELYTEALEICRRTFGNDHVTTCFLVANLGATYGRMGKTELSAQYTREAYETRERVFGPDHPQTLQSLNNLALNLTARGMYDEALPVFHTVMERQVRVLGEEHPYTLWTRGAHAMLIGRMGRLAEAESILRQLVDDAIVALPEGHWYVARFKGHLGIAILKQGRVTEAEPILLDAYELAAASNPAAAKNIAEHLVDAYERLEREEDAARYRAIAEGAP